METSVLNECSVTPVEELPEIIDLNFVKTLLHVLEAVSRTEVGPSIRDVIPEAVATELVERATSTVADEGVIVYVEPSTTKCVNVHGDLHGHFFDLRHCLLSEGVLEGAKYCVFNGDFVDRGAWGVEVILMLAALKLALPSQIYLLRGNHECEALASVYGFQKELEYKYPGQGRKKASLLMKKFAAFFSALPIAALVANKTLVVHGGLWRRPNAKRKGTTARRKPNSRGKSSADVQTGQGLLPKDSRRMGTYKSANLQLGTLDDLRKATKGGLNPGYNQRKHVVASDLLWSDPQGHRGLAMNPRGSGLLFGPDASEWFLKQNDLNLIIRSHEGPEARLGRDDMAGMQNGYTLDHDTTAGAVITVFSAADYPQFQYEDAETGRFNNKGAIVVLRPPSYCEFTIKSYTAASRPAGICFFELDAPDSADEMPECAGPVSDCEDMSGTSQIDGLLPTADALDTAFGISADMQQAEDVKGDKSPALDRAAAGAMQCNSEHIQVLGRGQRSRVAKRPR